MVKSTLAKKSTPMIITLSDGKEYTMKPVTLNLLVELEDKFDQPASALLISGRIKPIRYLLYLRLKDAYHDLTEESIGELVDDKVMLHLKDVMGV